jgi:hypothetical protein
MKQREFITISAARRLGRWLRKRIAVLPRQPCTSRDALNTQ